MSRTPKVNDFEQRSLGSVFFRAGKQETIMKQKIDNVKGEHFCGAKRNSGNTTTLSYFLPPTNFLRYQYMSIMWLRQAVSN